MNEDVPDDCEVQDGKDCERIAYIELEDGRMSCSPCAAPDR